MLVRHRTRRGCLVTDGYSPFRHSLDTRGVLLRAMIRFLRNIPPAFTTSDQPPSTRIDCLCLPPLTVLVLGPLLRQPGSGHLSREGPIGFLECSLRLFDVNFQF